MKDGVDELTVLYAASTVLLDLTANETCIEQISLQLKELNLFKFIVRKLHYFIDLTQSQDFRKKKDYN